MSPKLHPSPTKTAKKMSEEATGVETSLIRALNSYRREGNSSFTRLFLDSEPEALNQPSRMAGLALDGF